MNLLILVIKDNYSSCQMVERNLKNIQCRLYRGLGNMNFLNSFSPVRIQYLSRRFSDHATMAIELEVENQH